jgi:hypothetical protein
MSLLVMDVAELLARAVDTLTEEVQPAVSSDHARMQVGAVVELLRALQSRVAWDPEVTADAVTRSNRLAAAIGAPGASDLVAVREQIYAVLSETYRGDAERTAAATCAVLEFSSVDVERELS